MNFVRCSFALWINRLRVALFQSSTQGKREEPFLEINFFGVSLANGYFSIFGSKWPYILIGCKKTEQALPLRPS